MKIYLVALFPRWKITWYYGYGVGNTSGETSSNPVFVSFHANEFGKDINLSLSSVD